MADILSKGSLFPEELIPDFIKKTTGASALAKLCSAIPHPLQRRQGVHLLPRQGGGHRGRERCQDQGRPDR